MNTVAISKLRSNLPGFVDKVNNFMERIVVTVAGKPKAVLVSFEELESLEETAEILAIPSILQSVQKARKEIKNNKTITLAELEEKYRASHSLKRS